MPMFHISLPPPTILTDMSPAPVLEYTTNTISEPPLETSFPMSCQVSLPHYVHHSLLFFYSFVSFIISSLAM